MAIVFGAAILFPLAMKLFVEDGDGRRRWLRSLLPKRPKANGVGVMGSGNGFRR